MSTLTLSIPDSIRCCVESLAREDGVPVDDFVASILSQRIAVEEADSYVRRRASRGSAEPMRETLKSAPEVDPDDEDRLPRPPEGKG